MVNNQYNNAAAVLSQRFMSAHSTLVHSPTIYTLLQCMDLINRESPGHTVYDGQALDVRQAAIIIRSKLSGSIHLCHYNYGTNIQQ